MTKKVKEMNFDIYKSGAVACLSFSVWGARTKLKEGDLGLENIPEDKIVLGQKRLIKREIFSKIDSIYHEAKNFLNGSSFDFPFGSARFVPYARLQRVLDKESECEKKFYEEVESFLDEYDSNRVQMLSEYDQLFEEILKQSNGLSAEDLVKQKKVLISKLRDKYPTKEELRKRFKFEFVLFEVASPEFKSVSAEDALGESKKFEAMEKVYREKISQKLDVFLEDVVSRLKTMVLGIVAKLSLKLEKDSVSMSTVRSFQRFAESFKEMDFVDLGIDEAIASLETKLASITKSDLDDKKFKETLNQELEKIKVVADSIDDNKVLGRFKRHLRVIGE